MNRLKLYLIPGVLSTLLGSALAEEATILVQADQVIHRVSPYLTGACLEDVNHEVYGGIYSQMIFGESFQEPAATGSWGAVSGMWTPVVAGSASGQCSIETTNPFVGTQSQVITFASGTGEIGMANQGLNHWGMNFVAGNEYDGCLDVRADAPTTITLSLESSNGITVYAQTNLLVASNTWEHLNFALTPSAGDSDGRFAITLTQAGTLTVGYAFLEPGSWGRFNGQPVRNDVAQGLINQGITVLRYGGSMVNAAGYRWTNMIGPRDLRPPYPGTWYPYSSDGWGIPDFLNFCDAAGFLGVPDFNINETAENMADFVQYANGSTNTAWGAQRAADGHPQPYGLKYLELGNEERVDSTYFQKFQALAQAIWAADSNITLVVGDFAYHQIITDPFNFRGADSGISTLAVHRQIMQLAKRHNRAVWFDVHVWTDGPTPDGTLAATFAYDNALGKISDGADYKVVVFELNANNHSLQRALANALAINAIERDGRLPIVSSANCLQPDGENNNGWDQGLLFLNQSEVWLQPPGYVTRMLSHHAEPLLINASVAAPDNLLKANAKRSEDGKMVVLEVVNLSEQAAQTKILIRGYSLAQAVADTEELSGPLRVVNTAKMTNQICSLQKHWQPGFKNNETDYEFQPHSFTVITFNQSR